MSNNQRDNRPQQQQRPPQQNQQRPPQQQSQQPPQQQQASQPTPAPTKARRIFSNKPSREGEMDPALGRRTNEYKTNQRNPEPTTRISPPKIAPGTLPARFDAPGVVEGAEYNVERSEIVPPAPPSTKYDWDAELETFFMLQLQGVVSGELTSAEAQLNWRGWLDGAKYDKAKGKERDSLVKRSEFLSGRVSKASLSVLESFRNAVNAKQA